MGTLRDGPDESVSAHHACHAPVPCGGYAGRLMRVRADTCICERGRACVRLYCVFACLRVCLFVCCV